MSRAGRLPTGVDRVEMAYAAALLARGGPLWGLVRTARAEHLLGRDGVAALLAAAERGEWGRPDLRSRLSRRLPPARRAAESRVRALAVASRLDGRLLPGLRGLLRRLPPGTATLSVGLSGLGERRLAALARRGPLAVMIHDAIPLDHPGFARPGEPARFAARLRAVARHARLVLCPSEAAAGDLRRWLPALGLPAPPILAVPLAVPVPVPEPAALPTALPGGLPPRFFVTLGTIEPRKNHALLLDLWEGWPQGWPQGWLAGPGSGAAEGEAAGAPHLLVVGARGWENRETLARLDARPPGVVELAGLPDGAVAALLVRALALLMPSRAEGFGLPAAEAAALGTPVICSDLPALREVLGDTRGTVYLAPDDRYGWAMALRRAARGGPPRPAPRPAPAPASRAAPRRSPGWEAHLAAVLDRLAAEGREG